MQKTADFFFQVKTQLNFEVILIISNNVSYKIKEFFYYLVIGFVLKNENPLDASPMLKMQSLLQSLKKDSDTTWPSYSYIYNHTLSMDLEQSL